ncbi:MAG: MFS transporter [Deltaproteobacteria bacterium]|nr:MFS transporter [Deltaproteobacteria bacterium]MBI3388018.1 MFS transporter [Deltaproteobacteria bacterium]
MGDERLPLRSIAVYSLPMLGIGYMFGLVNFYLLKFSTDVLLVAPATMGLIFGISRLWDAFFDLPAGYLSDRTVTRLGRRRPWLLASVVPISVVFLALWSPPDGLSGTALTLWMAAGVILFYSAQTIFNVPHSSLGAELTVVYHERTRVFAARLIADTGGVFLALVGIFLLERSSAPRAMAYRLSLIAAVVTAGLILFSIAQQRERAEYQGRGSTNPYTAFADVWRNPHARLLLATFFIELLGVASLSTLIPYVSEYILHTPGYTSYYLLGYLLPFAVSIPVWIPLSRRFGKRNAWVASMVVKGLAFGSCFFLGEGDWLQIIAVVTVVGVADGCGRTIAPSLQADVIDYDEYRTGQRKEGAYFAAWNLAAKGAMAVAVVLTGFVLQASGFRPNAEQTETTKLALRVLMAIFPLVFYAIAAVIGSRFRLNESEHAEIRAALAAGVS